MTAADPYIGTQGLGEVEVPPASGATGQPVGEWLHRPLTPTLSRGTADRGEDLRDPARLRETWSSARILVVDPDGRCVTEQVDGRPALRFEPAADRGSSAPADAVLIGTVDGIDHWAVAGEVPPQAGERADAWSRGGTGGLRQWGALLGDTDAGLLTTAVAILNWHRSARFCPRCGLPNEPELAGWARRCGNGHQEFPRTDPAVIVLVHDGADNMLLARQPIWPEHRYSILAGFTEAGESLEATVYREVREEVGVEVTGARYLGSQPWPFPRSLMVGFAARAESAAPLLPRAGEIEDARWVTRTEIRDLLAAGGEREDLILPASVSIARLLIESWARG
jgi:NAD+ diphosphatase